MIAFCPQANCIGALVGLSLAGHSHAAAYDEATLKALFSEASEYISHSHWTTLAIHTVLSVVTPDHRTTLRIWQIGGQVSNINSNTQYIMRDVLCTLVIIMVLIHAFILSNGYITVRSLVNARGVYDYSEISWSFTKFTKHDKEKKVRGVLSQALMSVHNLHPGHRKYCMHEVKISNWSLGPD